MPTVHQIRRKMNILYPSSKDTDTFGTNMFSAMCFDVTSFWRNSTVKSGNQKPSWRVEKPSITKKRTISFWRVTLNPPTKRNVGIGSCRWTNTGAFRWTLFPLPPSRLKEQDIDIVYLAIYYIYNISPIIHPYSSIIYHLTTWTSQKKPDIVTTCDTIDAPTR